MAHNYAISQDTATIYYPSLRYRRPEASGELQDKDSGQNVVKHIQKSFSEFTDRKLPRVFEALFYHPDTKRKNDEAMAS